MSKLTDLPQLDVLDADDLLYVVSNETSYSIPVGQLFQSIDNPAISGNVSFSDVQLMTAGGVVDLSKPITNLIGNSGSNEIEIPDGEEGQLKIIAMTHEEVGSDYTLTGNLMISGNVIFSEEGETLTLLFLSGNWLHLGGSLAVS